MSYRKLTGQRKKLFYKILELIQNAQKDFLEITFYSEDIFIIKHFNQ